MIILYEQFFFTWTWTRGTNAFRTQFHYCLQITALSKDILNGTNAKIGVDAVKDFTSRSNKGMTRAGEIAELIDMVKLEHSIISKYVAPERLNGVFNLFFALAYTNSTSAEIESALVSM